MEEVTLIIVCLWCTIGNLCLRLQVDERIFKFGDDLFGRIERGALSCDKDDEDKACSVIL